MKNILLTGCLLTALTGATQNAGIGISSPTHARLEINGSVGAAVAMFGSDKYGTAVLADNPEIGFNYYFNGTSRTIKAGYAANMGMSPADGSFYIGTFNGNQSAADFSPITGYREAMRIKQNGYVGIGTDPVYPLTIQNNSSGGGIVQESPDGTAQVGFYTGFAAAYLQTWTNTPLNFATGNGVSRMVLSTNGSLTISKSLNLGVALHSTATGSSNLLPVAFGKVSSTGNIIFSTGNITVIRAAAGQYQLTIDGEDLATDINKFTLMITPGSSNEISNPFNIDWVKYTISGGVIYVTTGLVSVNAQQITSCGCASSYINSSNIADPFDCAFDITIYKNN